MSIKKKLKENYENGVGNVHAVVKPFTGCTVAGMVKEFDPVMGAQHHGIDSQAIHGIYGTPEEATKVAEGLHAQHLEEERKLEEKKGKVAKKLTTAINSLEKERDEHMKMAKENPKDSTHHREHAKRISDRIEELMDKLAKVEKSKKEKEVEEDKEKEELKENESKLSPEQKKVESFVKKIAKEFEYSTKDAARFITDTIKKLDLK